MPPAVVGFDWLACFNPHLGLRVVLFCEVHEVEDAAPCVAYNHDGLAKARGKSIGYPTNQRVRRGELFTELSTRVGITREGADGKESQREWQQSHTSPLASPRALSNDESSGGGIEAAWKRGHGPRR